MPEYRRFVAYFYEYIDGKKQKNTGFAKVELRNGIWRILFRLTAPVHPRPPVEVFGFVRKGDNLLGLPMGTMRAGKEMMEEWAYHADDTLWLEKYGLSDIAGIWIRSGDGRHFITVWDEEPVDPKRFVTVLSEEKTEESAEKAADSDDEKVSAVEEVVMDNAHVTTEKNGERMNEAPAQAEKENALQMNMEYDEQNEMETAGQTKMEQDASIDRDKITACVDSGQHAEKITGTEAADAGQAAEAAELSELENQKLWDELYRKRMPFQPFTDQEISDCIRVAPNDIMQLQRARWSTGRNSFLMHGYYNYRHLMIGRTAEGKYVLGVPGIMNPQEKYLAVMFGFPNFKYADESEQNTAGGYWYRILEQGMQEK